MLVFAFVVSCSADKTSSSPNPPLTEEQLFAADFRNVTVTVNPSRIYFMSSANGMCIITKDGQFDIDSVYEGDEPNTIVARYKK